MFNQRGAIHKKLFRQEDQLNQGVAGDFENQIRKTDSELIVPVKKIQRSGQSYLMFPMHRLPEANAAPTTL